MSEDQREKRKEKENKRFASAAETPQQSFESKYLEADDPKVFCAVDGTKCTGPCKDKAVVGNIIRCSETYKTRTKRF
jgi:hypothetical protein